MRLVTYSMRNKYRLGVLKDDFVLDAQKAGYVLLGNSSTRANYIKATQSLSKLIQNPGILSEVLPEVAEQILQKHADNLELIKNRVIIPQKEIRIHAPLQNPGKIICAAGNFPISEAAPKPTYPTLFLKPTSSITGPNCPIFVSLLTTNIAYEVELGIIIGKQAHNIPMESAKSHIAGYVLANDVGDRVLETRTSQWTSGKMFDSFTPLGPWMVTTDEIAAPNRLMMDTYLNGVMVQKGNTSEMFYDAFELVSYVSHLTTLHPGDMLLTGSPKMMDGIANPVFSLKPGDVVKVAIDGLGELTNPLKEEPHD